VTRLRKFKLTVLALFFTVAGCFASYPIYSAAGGGRDAALGEQHDAGFPAQDTYVAVQDVLRGEGVLFEVKPQYQLITLWRDADTPAGIWGSLIGVHPRYRYEIEVVPTGPRQSRIVVNVRTEDIADNDLNSYEATKRLDLFNRFEELAARLPPPSTTPRAGGVNFALLPGEDLQGLAKRVTGSADNWREIAKDNGLTSPTDLAGVQSIWVKSSLLEPTKGSR